MGNTGVDVTPSHSLRSCYTDCIMHTTSNVTAAFLVAQHHSHDQQPLLGCFCRGWGDRTEWSYWQHWVKGNRCDA